MSSAGRRPSSAIGWPRASASLGSGTASTEGRIHACDRSSRRSGPSPIPTGRCDVVDDLLIEAGIRLTQRPNVDLGLGALSFVAGFRPASPMFAVARLAGFGAHYLEERDERPLRFRGVARQVER